MDNVSFSEESLNCRILAIDNGTDLVGFSVVDYNIRTGRMDVVMCETFRVPSGYRNNNNLTLDRRGNLAARLDYIATRYVDLLDEYYPDLIACESPFGFRMMQAFKVLTLSIQMFDDIAYDLYPHMDFMRITPLEAKKAAIGDGKFSHQKDLAHQYLLKNKKVVFDSSIDVDSLGPDALDSVTVAMAAGDRVLY